MSHPTDNRPADCNDTSYRSKAPVPAVIGLAKLATLYLSGGDIMPTYRQLAAELAHDISNVGPLMDIAILDHLLDCGDRGLTIQSAALRAQRLFRLASHGPPARLRLVGFAMAGPPKANMPIEFLIDDSDVTLFTLYIVPGMPLPVAPEHDLAIVLAAESEQARPILREIERLAADWPVPVLNRPHLVPLLGRETLHKLLATVEGVEIPETVRVNATTFAQVGDGTGPIEDLLLAGGFPIITRPVDSHSGHGLEKIETSAAIEAYLLRNQVPEYFVSRFVDYRSRDGRYRKYRIAVIDGTPIPSHLAISDHWMVHFLNADMSENADNRREEERFMDQFQTDFAVRHGRAFAEIAERSGLDYFGVDCAETRDGKLLIFEAGTTLIVHNMDSEALFPYKGPHMRLLFEAFRSMLFRKAELTVSEPAADRWCGDRLGA